MRTAVFPGSFDPPTLGHINIISRAVDIFDRLYVVVADNPGKPYTMESSMRCGLMRQLTTRLERVEVCQWDRLIVDFAEQKGAKVVIRGVRPFGDFDYEFQLSMINKGINSSIETLFIPTDSRYFVLRSSLIKEVVRLNGDISTMVPPEIIDIVRKHYRSDE